MRMDTSMVWLVLEERLATLELLMGEQASSVIREQRHLDANSPERVYWHYGYLMALRNVLATITGRNPESKTPAGKAGKSDFYH
jgi:hypothetical protein